MFEAEARFSYEMSTVKPGYSISYKIACAISEYSDQPTHPHRLITLLDVRLKTLWIHG